MDVCTTCHKHGDRDPSPEINRILYPIIAYVMLHSIQELPGDFVKTK